MTDNFAARAAEWDNPAKVQMTSVFVNELMKNTQLNKGMKGLEVGAGTGLVGFKILPHIGSIVFEDTSPAMLEVLSSKITTENNIEILNGEIEQYQNKDIDLIFSCMAFHHIPDTASTIKHFFKITTDKAKVIIGDLVTEDGSFHHFEPIPHKGFDLEILQSEFIKAGFPKVSAYVYNTLSRERTPGVMSNYDQFILVAEK